VVLLIATVCTIAVSFVAPSLAARFKMAIFALTLATVTWSFIPFSRPRTVNELLDWGFWNRPVAAATPVAQLAPTLRPNDETQPNAPAPTERPTILPTSFVRAQIPTAIPPPQPTLSGPLNIMFWAIADSTEESARTAALRKLLDEYRQVAPNTMIQLNLINYTDACEVACKVSAAIGTDNSPDIIQAPNPEIAILYEQHTIVALNYFMARSLTAGVVDDFQKPLLDSGNFCKV
jgi:hypothetical protein